MWYEFEDKHWRPPHSAAVCLFAVFDRGRARSLMATGFIQPPGVGNTSWRAHAFPRVLVGAVVSQLHGLFERIVGGPSPNLQIPDRLKRRLGAAAQVDEAVSRRARD